ncbi:amino acid adenylation domain-containing protein [Fulvivirgaceae bacterium BMA10]|uniref:Amino acid adenylation domain-containing protein n=1 Tax=Splendidivirga corallicola TaxID=3051826 RepID=A0ABT8KZI7_9BACT|nr:amino acid adenylation domain-containing protein [Fulvivirgaceae bacterium BMA10]
MQKVASHSNIPMEEHEQAIERATRSKGDIQNTLIEIFKEVYRLKNINATYNFSKDLKNSLLTAAQAAVKIQQTFNIEIPLKTFIEHETILSLSDFIDRATEKNQSMKQLGPKKSWSGEIWPASFAQKRLWFLDQVKETGHTYNLPISYELKGSLNADILEECFQILVDRHESFRTSFFEKDGEVYQCVAPQRKVNMEYHDLSGLPEDHQKSLVKDFTRKVSNHKFNLETDPLIKFTLISLSNEHHFLVINMHHIISDAWSISIFLSELSDIYENIVTGNKPSLAALAFNYVAYTKWQNERLDGNLKNNQLKFWVDQLQGAAPILELPTDRPRPIFQTFNGGRVRFRIDGELNSKLQAYSAEHDCSIYRILIAAYKTLLYRYSGQEDIIIGTPVNGRQKKELEPIIGFFVNTLALRTEVSGNPSFKELLNRIKNTISGALGNQELPFDQLIEELHPNRTAAWNPIFQVMFVLQKEEKHKFDLGSVKAKRIEKQTISAKFDLTWEVIPTSDGFECSLDFNADLFDYRTIQNMSFHLQSILENCLTQPDLPVTELPMLLPEEKNQILIEWNQTELPYPKDRCLHQLFEEQVYKTPEAIAIVHNDIKLSYQELNQKVNQLAHCLIEKGADIEDFIGIHIDRTPEMVIGVLATLKAGAAYVAIDPQYPEDRKRLMAEDANLKFLLTSQNKSNPIFQHNIETIFVDDFCQYEANQFTTENPVNRVSLNNLAYMIYTSGSTGRPKGVLIEHKGLPNLIFDHIRKYNLTEASCVLQFASLSFDASICEIGMALTSGASLCLAKKESILPGPELIELLKDKKISHVTLPPSALSILPQETLPELKVITVTGEACPEILIDRWADDRKFFNGYGPSEVTIGATIAEFSETQKKTSIGRPFANYKIYILDKYQQPVPVGVPGEIYIGGIGLARGYHQRPDLTKEKFIDNPFVVGEKIYRTGDLAKYLPDGQIDFIGRIDNMVKMRGMRIELGEIEARINAFENIESAVVIVREDQPGRQVLTGYFTTKNNADISLNELKLELERKLPKHMIPTYLVALSRLPISPNGKVDREKLPIPNPATDVAFTNRKEPTSEKEKKLAIIWKKVLNIDEISIQDNFFDLGGHSLLAVTLFTEIEKELKLKIPVSVLFKFPTIEELAKHIVDLDGTQNQKSLIVPINNEGSLPPLYLVHTPSGHVLSYYSLAEHLGKDQPIYGLQARGLENDHKLLYNLEEMAKSYVDEIMRFQPSGPYYLGGYCFGGLLAYEIARQFEMKGQKVAQLFLMGSYVPKGVISDISLDKFDGEIEIPSPRQVPVNKRRSKNPIALWKRREEIKKILFKRSWKLGYRFFRKIGLPLPKAMIDIKLINAEALKAHTIKSYKGAIEFIQPEEKDPKSYYIATRAWEQFALGGVHNYTVKGTQSKMLGEPSSKHLAEIIGEAMNQEHFQEIHENRF